MSDERFIKSEAHRIADEQIERLTHDMNDEHPAWKLLVEMHARGELVLRGGDGT